MLREYQQRAIDMLYAWFEAGGRGNPCLYIRGGDYRIDIARAIEAAHGIKEKNA